MQCFVIMCSSLGGVLCERPIATLNQETTGERRHRICSKERKTTTQNTKTTSHKVLAHSVQNYKAKNTAGDPVFVSCDDNDDMAIMTGSDHADDEDLKK